MVPLPLQVLACAFAMVAQFWPSPFPESRPLLGICCSSYFALSGILQLVVWFWERDAIMFTEDAMPATSGAKRASELGLRIRSSFPRFQVCVAPSYRARRRRRHECAARRGGREPLPVLRRIEIQDDYCSRPMSRFARQIDSPCILPRPVSAACGVALLDRHSAGEDEYTLIIQLNKPEGTTPTTTETWSVGKFFDVDGNFWDIGYCEAVDKLLAKFEAKKYD